MDWFLAIMAGIGVFLTYLQFKLKTQEHKFKLYDRRIDSYLAVDTLYARMRADGIITQDAMDDFMSVYARAALLFNDPIRNLVGSMYKSALEAQLNAWELEHLPVGPRRSELVKTNREITDLLGSTIIPDLTEKMARTIAPSEDLTPLSKWGRAISGTWEK